MPNTAQSLPRSSTLLARSKEARSPSALAIRPGLSKIDGPGPQDGLRPLLLCFSHLRWNFVFQRPQHLLTRAARSHRVAVFEEPVFGDVEIPGLEVTEVAASISVLVPHLPEGMSEPRRPRLHRRHEPLRSQASTAIPTSTPSRRASTPHFGAGARGGRADPPDQAGIPRPRIGFFGVIDERMDIDLVANAAAARPDWQYIMLGPVVKIDPRDLPRRPNVHWLGGKAYD
jgi:hypothetical protein